MSHPDDNQVEQIPAGKSPCFAKATQGARPARERVLPVAQIYQVLDAERQGRDQAMITLIIGDERTTPKRHGIRASRADWRALIAALAKEDAELRAEIQEDLRPF